MAETVTIRIDPRVIAEIDAAARHLQMSRSKLMREATAAYLNQRYKVICKRLRERLVVVFADHVDGGASGNMDQYRYCHDHFLKRGIVHAEQIDRDTSPDAFTSLALALVDEFNATDNIIDEVGWKQEAVSVS